MQLSYETRTNDALPIRVPRTLLIARNWGCLQRLRFGSILTPTQIFIGALK